jgi:hypothetical protein
MEPQMDLVFFFNCVELTEETVLNAPAGLPIPVKGARCAVAGEYGRSRKFSGHTRRQETRSIVFS